MEQLEEILKKDPNIINVGNLMERIGLYVSYLIRHEGDKGYNLKEDYNDNIKDYVSA